MTGTATVWNLTIVDGNITANSVGLGAGIGAGYSTAPGTSRVGILSVLGGRIIADGSLAGIGSGGEGSEVELLQFSGNAILSCNAPVTKFPINATSIVLSNASLSFATKSNQLFGVCPSIRNFSDWVILYENITTRENEPLSQRDSTLLQIGNITAPLSSDWKLCVSGSGYEKCYLTPSSIVKSLIVTVPSQGNYSVTMLSNAASGFLQEEKGVSHFLVPQNGSFVADAHLVLFPATPSCTGTFTLSLLSGLTFRKKSVILFGHFIFAAWFL
jgi:hypothetical protein